jgi:hypothetical protein
MTQAVAVFTSIVAVIDKEEKSPAAGAWHGPPGSGRFNTNNYIVSSH